MKRKKTENVTRLQHNRLYCTSGREELFARTVQ